MRSRDFTAEERRCVNYGDELGLMAHRGVSWSPSTAKYAPVE